jgi:hypothetical protein
LVTDSAARIPQRHLVQADNHRSSLLSLPLCAAVVSATRAVEFGSIAEAIQPWDLGYVRFSRKACMD